MNRTVWMTDVAALLIALQVVAQTPHRDPELSTAEQAIVGREIATLKSQEDRSVAEGWTNAKKVAELLCRPAALSVLKKQVAGVDRVFLGTSRPDTLTLESNQLLTGSGEYRTAQGWQDFTFTCELNPETARVTRFKHVAVSARQ